MKKFCVLALAISALTIGTAQADKPKGYTVTIPEGRIGSNDIEAGEYKLLIHRDEMKAEVVDVDTGERCDVSGKVETADSKFPRTEVLTQTTDGVKRISEIRIGGTSFKVNFRNTSAQ